MSDSPKVFPMAVALGFVNAFTRPFGAATGDAGRQLKSLEKVAKGATLAITAPFAALGALAIRDSMAFDKYAAFARRYVSTNKEKLQQQRKLVESVADEYGMTDDVVSETWKNLTKELGDFDEVAKHLKETAALGLVTEQNPQAVVNQVTEIANAFAMGNDKLHEVRQSMARLDVASHGKIALLSNSLVELAPRATKAKLNLEQLAAVMLAIDEGEPGARPGIRLEDQLRGLKALLDEARQLDRKLKDPIGNLIDVARRHSLDRGDTGLVAQALVGSGAHSLEEVMAFVDRQKSLEEQLEGFTDTSLHNWNALKTELSHLRNELFESGLIDGFNAFVGHLRDAVKWMSGLSPATKTAIGYTAAFAAMVGPLLKLVAGFIKLQAAMKFLRSPLPVPQLPGGTPGLPVPPVVPTPTRGVGALWSMLGGGGGVASLTGLGLVAAQMATGDAVYNQDGSFSHYAPGGPFGRGGGGAIPAGVASLRTRDMEAAFGEFGRFRPGGLAAPSGVDRGELADWLRSMPPQRAEVSIRIEGLPPGAQVTTSGDAGVSVDRGPAMPHARVRR